MTTLDVTVVELSVEEGIDFWVPKYSLEEYVLITKFPDGKTYNYKTDGNIQKLLMEDKTDGSEYEGINVTEGSYVILFNREEVIMCTLRDDYDELVRIVQEAILS